MSRLSVLAGVGTLMALSWGAARAQSPSAGSLRPAPPALAGAVAIHPQNGLLPVTRYSSASSDRGVGLLTGTSMAGQPFVGSARLGVSPPPSNAMVAHDSLAAVQGTRVRRRGPGVALMIVGAAGVITGLLIDESIVTIAGAGVGLFGLYRYLR